jgi:hypothetical protein
MNPTLLLNQFVTKLIEQGKPWQDVWTTNPNDLKEYLERKRLTTDSSLYPGTLSPTYKDQIFLTLKLENFETYYIHFTTKNILYTKTLQLSSVLICRKLLAKGIVVEKKLNLNKFKDTQSLVDYLYNKIFIEKINYSNDTTITLEEI